MTVGARQQPHWTEALRHPWRSFHTVRHLHAAQIVNRAARTFRRFTSAPSATGETVLLGREAVRPADATAAAFDGDSFSFLNRRIRWGGPERWHPAGADDLWIYNLHYFRFLWLASPAAARALVADWIEVNGCRESLAWHAYPISIRLREWIEWLLAHQDVDGDLQEAMRRSIVRQAEHLMGCLEYHLMGNHLLENAITLCWAGLSFGGRQAGAWLAKGREVLRREVDRQLLSDGTHDERSPMYQALLAEALLRLSEVAACSSHASAPAVRQTAEKAGRRMLASLGGLVHPDGDYALLNDAALGVAPSFDALTRRFGRPSARPAGPEGWALEAAGYFGRRDESGGYLVFDAGPIGPDHQPGHGHADTLSFELSHRGRRVVTDTGVFTYAPGQVRQYDRGTAAHNTIEIDGHDQSELWGAFRCARRPSVVRATMNPEGAGLALSGGYRGPGRGQTVGHEREIFASGHMLAFTDTLTASGAHRATLRLHFAPRLSLRQRGRGWTIEAGEPRSVARVVGCGLEWKPGTSPYHPEFGRELERPSLSADVSFRDRATIRWWLMLN